MGKRLFIVSSRLPVVVDNETGVQPASGGLVTAINSYLGKKEMGSVFSARSWVGIPGCTPGVWSNFMQGGRDGAFSYIPIFVNLRDTDLLCGLLGELDGYDHASGFLPGRILKWFKQCLNQEIYYFRFQRTLGFYFPTVSFLYGCLDNYIRQILPISSIHILFFPFL